MSKVPLYYLDFAVHLYNMFVTCPAIPPDLSHRIDVFFKQYEAIRKARANPPQYPYMDREKMSNEKSLTAILARALDRFLFVDEDPNGACYHQMITRINSKNGIEASDTFVMRLQDYMPHSPVVVGDAKSYDLNKADLESDCYAITISQNIYRKNHRPVMMTLPATLHDIMLNVYTSSTQCIEVAHIETANETDFKRFSYILFRGVHLLLNNKPLVVEGFFKVCCSDNRHKPLDAQPHRVFQCLSKNVVLKFFQLLPNIEVLKELYSRLQYELRPVTSDGTFKCLVCNFLRPSRNNIKKDHIIQLLKTLDTLHKKGYVHSDIRTTNIIFCKSAAYFIDFDLMDVEDTDYPTTYNHYYIKERHPHARAHNKRKKEHDRYSLYRVLIQKIEHFTRGQREIIKEIEGPKELGEIIKQLEDYTS